MADATQLVFQRPTGCTLDVIPPKYLVQLSGSVCSIYLIEPLNSSVFGVVRLLRMDAYAGVPVHSTAKDHFQHWFPSAPNVEQSTKIRLPAAHNKYIDPESCHFQSVFFAPYAILVDALHWRDTVKPSLGGPGMKASMSVNTLVTTPGDTEVQLNADKAALVPPPIGAALQPKEPKRRRAVQFWAVDPDSYTLLKRIYNTAACKVWTARRVIDGAELVIKFCSRTSALISLQAYLRLAAAGRVMRCYLCFSC